MTAAPTTPSQPDQQSQPDERAASAQDRNDVVFSGINGINIAVGDLDLWRRRYDEVFGVTGTDVEPDGFAFPGLRGVSYDLAGFNLNLISSEDESTSVGRFLARRGDGFFLLSMKVDDAEAATEELRRRGMEPLLAEPSTGEGHPPVNFFHPKQLGGVQLEIIEMAE